MTGSCVRHIHHSGLVHSNREAPIYIWHLDASAAHISPLYHPQPHTAHYHLHTNTHHNSPFGKSPHVSQSSHPLTPFSIPYTYQPTYLPQTTTPSTCQESQAVVSPWSRSTLRREGRGKSTLLRIPRTTTRATGRATGRAAGRAARNDSFSWRYGCISLIPSPDTELELTIYASRSSNPRAWRYELP
jgi:hypothetical protein